jgi:hypothetical protein
VFFGFGCSQVIKLEQVECHIKECLFNPTAFINYINGCGGIYRRYEALSHSCSSYLITENTELKNQLNKANLQLEEFKHEIEQIEKILIDRNMNIGQNVLVLSLKQNS